MHTNAQYMVIFSIFRYLRIYCYVLKFLPDLILFLWGTVNNWPRKTAGLFAYIEVFGIGFGLLYRLVDCEFPIFLSVSRAFRECA